MEEILNQQIDQKQIELYNNPFHEQNQYLRLHMEAYDPLDAGSIFSRLREQAGKTLQVMISSEDKKQREFLLAGGFQCKRRCYEIEASKEKLKEGLRFSGNMVPLHRADASLPEYGECAQVMYEYYKCTHERINPLTAELAAFCEVLPKEVLFQRIDGEIKHVAFVEEDEIAYIGSTDPGNIQPFAESLVAVLFDEFETITFECDDCDAVAMTLWQLFSIEAEESYDTYVLA